jgi:hypothetical protein
MVWKADTEAADAGVASTNASANAAGSGRKSVESVVFIYFYP